MAALLPVRGRTSTAAKALLGPILVGPEWSTEPYRVRDECCMVSFYGDVGTSLGVEPIIKPRKLHMFRMSNQHPRSGWPVNLPEPYLVGSLEFHPTTSISVNSSPALLAWTTKVVCISSSHLLTFQPLVIHLWLITIPKRSHNGCRLKNRDTSRVGQMKNSINIGPPLKN